MKRLEHIRTLRNQTSRFQAKTPNGAVIVLAQVAQEKQRLEQEKSNWATRIRKIEGRLKEIKQMETQLLAVAHLHRRSAKRTDPAGLSGDLPPGVAELTMRY
jgi:FtsZ-binding cell division protein ZapB